MDSPWLQCKVGPTLPAADGALVDRLIRTGRTGEIIIGYGVAEYEEAASRGELMCASGQAEVTFGTALTLTAVTFTLYNPVGSPVDLVLMNVGVTVRTATTAGHIVLAANVNNSAAIPSTNTALTVRNCRLDGSSGYGVAYSITTLPAAPVIVRTIAYVQSTTPLNTGIISDDVKGAVILGPNTAVTVQGLTIVGTGIISMMWRERKRLAA